MVVKMSGIFPWPSLKWQKLGLYAALFGGIFLILFSLATPRDAKIFGELLGVILFSLALYTALKTNWLNAKIIPFSAKISGGISIVCGWLVMIGLVLGITMIILIIILAIILAIASIFHFLRYH
jgi:hypothetical protein